MLYTPRREEKKDSVNDCQTYQERFEQVKDEVVRMLDLQIPDRAREDIIKAKCHKFVNVALNIEHTGLCC